MRSLGYHPSKDIYLSRIGIYNGIEDDGISKCTKMFEMYQQFLAEHSKFNARRSNLGIKNELAEYQARVQVNV